MNRALTSISIAVAVTLLGCAPADDSAPPAATASFTYPDGSPHPVTPWGEPDLQGN